MDKKQEELDNNEVVVTEIETEEVTETAPEKIVVKKSGGGFTLLIALLALGLSGYLFYQDWRKNGGLNLQDNGAESLQQLRDETLKATQNINKLERQIAELKQTHAKLNASLNEVKNHLTEQSSSDQQVSAFDNTDNEVALQRLQTQLNSQDKLIESLQSQLSNQPDIQTVGTLPNNGFDALEKTRIIQSLTVAQTLLDASQPETALATLNNLQQSTGVSFDYRFELQNIIKQLEQLKHPDIASLKSRLEAAKKYLSDIQLPTTTDSETSESKWYERFISVKKIEETSGVDSTFDLLAIKAQLSHQLQTAELLLNLKDQTGWQQSLLQAADLIKEKLPQQLNLAANLQQLAAESINAKVPKNLGLMALVDELKRSF
ncbi:MAG: hypothetical protein R3E90_13325 [Marinicella sp.]